MAPRHGAGFPATLCTWVGEIVQSSPPAARTTLFELIIGALLASGGHVTQALLALTPRLGWQAYHWMLEHGRFRLFPLVWALCAVVRREVTAARCFIIIDDTLAPRTSPRAPGAKVRFDHAAKANRPRFLLCQCLVTLAAVVPCRDRPRAVPILTGLCRGGGNDGKIAIARSLLRAVGDRLGPARLLVDAWYMRAPLVRTALHLGHEVVGQARRDTALFRLPDPPGPGRRGRPRRYGAKLDAAAADALPATVHRIQGYGGRRARLRDAVCRARFLKGAVVRAVWCELETRGGGWARARLLLSTDPTLPAAAVVEAYSRRWPVEPLVRDLKQVDGVGALWQRGRATLLRWLHLVQVARALLVLLTARADPEVVALIRLGGWRKAATLTPGLVKDALAAHFRFVEAFRLIPETCRKSGPVRTTGPPHGAAAA